MNVVDMRNEIFSNKHAFIPRVRYGLTTSNFQGSMSTSIYVVHRNWTYYTYTNISVMFNHYSDTYIHLQQSHNIHSSYSHTHQMLIHLDRKYLCVLAYIHTCDWTHTCTFLVITNIYMTVINIKYHCHKCHYTSTLHSINLK